MNNHILIVVTLVVTIAFVGCRAWRRNREETFIQRSVQTTAKADFDQSGIVVGNLYIEQKFQILRIK